LRGGWLHRRRLSELDGLFGMGRREGEAAQDRCHQQDGTDQSIHLLEGAIGKAVFLTVTARRCNAVRDP